MSKRTSVISLTDFSEVGDSRFCFFHFNFYFKTMKSLKLSPLRDCACRCQAKGQTEVMATAYVKTNFLGCLSGLYDDRVPNHCLLYGDVIFANLMIKVPKAKKG